MFSKNLNKKLDKYHLLNHPFYKAWNEGKLTREVIKDYAEPSISACKGIPEIYKRNTFFMRRYRKRKILLENLQMRKTKTLTILSCGKTLL